ncbi:hypothetical protein ASE92_12515 [Pedobacter sp. Leaf41]|nr:hypothetical protein ASE92_12515 [Pedobacter sp. Leaf41]
MDSNEIYGGSQAVLVPSKGRAEETTNSIAVSHQNLLDGNFFPQHIKLLNENDLTPIQEERLIVLEEFYTTSKSLQIISALTVRGTNAWKPLMERVYSFSVASTDDAKYNEALEAKLELGKRYTTRDIMRVVNGERRILGSKPHLVDILNSCLSDVSKIFMVHIDYEERADSKVNFPVYVTPFINLSAQL